MKRAKRLGAAMMLAGALSMGMATTAVAAAPEPTAPVVIVNGDFCSSLAEAIAFLEQRPESRLRDFLLAYLRHVFAAHCGGGV